MTSPVDTSVKYFSSTMSGAPVLSGTAGALVALLDACLKDGFDTKTLTSLVVAGGVATATYTGSHSALVDSVVLIAGVTGGPTGWAGLNGEQKIVAKPGTTSVTFATTLPDGAATGTITMKMAPLGWLKPFTGTNKAAYKPADPMATGMLLRVDDAGTTTCRVVGYESMSDIDNGVGPFPTPAQMSGGGYWPKSGVASAAAAGWVLVGDSRGFLIHFQPSLSTSASAFSGNTRYVGDIIPYKPSGDAYGFVLNYSATATPTSMNDGVVDGSNATLSAFPRGYSGLGSSVLHGMYPFTGVSNLFSGVDTSFGPFPSAIDGSLRLSRRYFATAATGVPPRGEVPGWFHAPQSLLLDTFRVMDRVTAAGDYAGRKLLVVNGTNTTTVTAPPEPGNAGAGFIDITGPWR